MAPDLRSDRGELPPVDRPWWTSPRMRWGGLALVVLVCLPALWNGIELDDVMTFVMVRDGEGSLWSWFSFADPRRTHHLSIDDRPWWAHPDLRMSFGRPLAALTHWIDLQGWPGAPWAMHLHSIAWYVLLVVLTGRLYRTTPERHGRAGLAMALFGLSQVHSAAVGWLSARNAIIGAVFVVAMMLVHRRQRTGDRRWAARLGPLWLAVGLSAHEGALAGLAYVGADVWVHERSRRGLALLWPYLVVVIAWRIWYVDAGFGAAHSGIYFDPGEDPLAYLARTILHGGLLLAARLGIGALDPLGALPGLYAFAFVFALVVIGGLTWLFRARLAADAEVRAFALGMLGCTALAGATLPVDRALLVVSIGGCFVLADIIIAGIQAPERSRRGVARALLVIHLFLSPLLFAVRVRGSAWIHASVENIALGVAQAGVDGSEPIILYNAPSDLLMLYGRVLARRDGVERPRPLQYLYAGLGALTVRRVDARTLELTATVPWLNAPLDRLLRRLPVDPGEVGTHRWFTTTVLATDAEGRPVAIRIAFDDLDRLERATFMRWGSGAPELARVPAVGETIELDPIPPVL